MKLSKAAAYFNKTRFLDAYTGALAFKGQLTAYDDSRRDSVTTERRVISVAPDVTLPARRTVAMEGETFILGTLIPDTFRGSKIRQAIIAQSAPIPCGIKTAGQLCSGAPGTDAFCNKVWVKNIAYTEQTSDLIPEYQIYFAEGEPVEVGGFIQAEGNVYFVRAVDDGASGIPCAVAEQLAADALAVATFGISTFDKVESRSTRVDVQAQVVQVRWQAGFRLNNRTTPKFGAGESLAIVARADVPGLGAGSNMTVNGRTHQVVSVEPYDLDTWLCRVALDA